MMDSITLNSTLGVADPLLQQHQQLSGEQAPREEDTQFQPLHPAPSLFHGHHGSYPPSAVGQQHQQQQVLSSDESQHLLPSPRGGDRSLSRLSCAVAASIVEQGVAYYRVDSTILSSDDAIDSGGGGVSLLRRFSDFARLDKKLSELQRASKAAGLSPQPRRNFLLAPLPPKTFFANTSAAFTEARRAALDRYLSDRVMEHKRRAASACGSGQRQSVAMERQCFVAFLGLRQYWVKREEAAIEAMALAALEQQRQQQQQQQRQQQQQFQHGKMMEGHGAIMETHGGSTSCLATRAVVPGREVARNADENANGRAGNAKLELQQQQQQQQRQQEYQQPQRHSGHPLLNSSIACRLSFAEVEVSSASALSIGASSVPPVIAVATDAAVAAAAAEIERKAEGGLSTEGTGSSSSSSGIETQDGEQCKGRRSLHGRAHENEDEHRHGRGHDDGNGGTEGDGGFVDEDEVCVTFDAEEPLGLRLRETLYPAPRVSITEAEMKTATATAAKNGKDEEEGGGEEGGGGRDNFICGPPVVIARFLRRDSPAALARVVAVGDAISRIAGVEVTSWPLERVVEEIGRARAQACAPGGCGAVQIHFARLWDGVGRRETRGGADCNNHDDIGGSMDNKRHRNVDGAAASAATTAPPSKIAVTPHLFHSGGGDCANAQSTSSRLPQPCTLGQSTHKSNQSGSHLASGSSAGSGWRNRTMSTRSIGSGGGFSECAESTMREELTF